MTPIKSETEYRTALKRVEQLEGLVNEDTPVTDPKAQELDMLVNQIEEYEAVHYPIYKPTLAEIIKLRLYEMGITQAKLAEMLGLSLTRVNRIVSGKSEPTLKTGRELSMKLGISPSIVLGIG